MRATKVCGWFSLICPTPEIIYTAPRTGPEESGATPSSPLLLLLFLLLVLLPSEVRRQSAATFTIALNDRRRAYAIVKKIEV